MPNYVGKITRKTDWGGDASTGFLPVAGSSVQGHIKEELFGKIGAVYKPQGGNMVYYFANNEDKQAYIETGDESLVLDSFEMESNYKVNIDTSRLNQHHSVIDGTKGNKAEFYFKITDDNGLSADASARIEFSFTGSGVSNKFTIEVPLVADDWTYVSVNVDDYLRSGSNSLSVKITGIATESTTQFTMTYNLFNLTFTPNFTYYEVQTGNTIAVPYIIECSDPKFIEFYIDGVLVDTISVPEPRRDGRVTLNTASLSSGQHTLQTRAYVRSSVDNTLFYTPSHFYTFAKEGEATPSFLMHMVLSNTTPMVGIGENLLVSLYQYEEINFDWSTYNCSGSKMTVKFEYDGQPVGSTVVDTNGIVNTFNYRPMNYGPEKVLKAYALDENGYAIFEHVIDVDVLQSPNGIEESTNRLLMKLQARGKRNSDDDRSIWSYVGDDGNEYFAEFNNFAWNSQQGWDEETESLVISHGATVDFYYRTNNGGTFRLAPMYNNWARNGGGGTIEMDIETFDIEDENAVICECKNGSQENEAFFRVTATKAEMSTEGQVNISTRYKDNDRLKIAFIFNPDGNNVDDNMMYIVINGVLERAAQYSNDAMQARNGYLSIGNPDGLCKVRLRSIRYYDRAISVDEAFNNYVIDSDDVQGIYDKNDVLNSVGEVGFDEIANKLPVMIFTGDMDDLVTAGMDKEWRRFDVEYINRQEPERNFVSFNCRMKLQGTSSLGYPRKNFKLNTKDKNFDESIYAASRFELDPNSVTGNLMLRDKRTGEVIDFDDFKTGGALNNAYTFTLDYKGEPLKKGKYRFRKNAHKAQKWTLKADFMESSCSHNVGAGRSWNDIFENTEFTLSKDTVYTNQTYKDSALVSNAEYLEYNGVDIEGNVQHYRIPNNTDRIKSQKDYLCRTDAQKICIAEGQDDVRTAIDGFPIVCFYRTSHASNDLVFIGQYNFINDKGSYEVFGFEDIEKPDDKDTMIYDASKVECWEGLKNTNPLSLFKTIDGFYDRNDDNTMFKWQETYESRYPDAEDYNGGNPEALHALSEWLVSTRHVSGETEYSGTLTIDNYFARRINDYQYGYTEETKHDYEYSGGTFEDNAENRQKKFEVEKWEHFDVWKLAGYYIYLMRYGAVDQFVKNTMLFTDGNGRYDPRTDKKYRKWFFINYDNDCLFGLRNNGQLAFHWDLDRQTRDGASDILDDGGKEEGANAYAMMGHDSTLWNNLEQDEEFMRMVRDLDYAMTKYKLTYDNMVKEFDTDQTEKWCERVYNANERYKYINAAKGIGDMAGRPVDNLWMLQGTRRSHRHWWIANHFNLLDAKWLSGEYKNTYVEIKTSCDAGVAIKCKAGADYYFAWGQLNRSPYESNMVRKEGDDIDFVFPTVQSQGDPVCIYAFNKLTEMDFSEMASMAFGGSFHFAVASDNIQNMMKKLIIGNPNVVNTLITNEDTKTWWLLGNLEYLDITNMFGITNIDLSVLPNLNTFKASGTKLSTFIPADGSVYENVELPNTIGTLTLNNITFKNGVYNDLNYTPTSNLNRLTISSNNKVGKDYYYKLVLPWINAINAMTNPAQQFAGKELTLKNIDWTFNSLDDIRIFEPFAGREDFKITGVIDLRDCGNLSMEHIDEIKHIFGENCFNQYSSPLYVKTPESVFISSSSDSTVAGQEHIFERVIYPDENAIEGSVAEIKYYTVVETTRPKADAGDDIIFSDPIAGKNYLVVSPGTIRTGLSLETTRDGSGKEIGILRSVESIVGSDTTFLVLVYMNIIGLEFDKVSVMPFTVKDPTYATNATISGSKSLYSGKEYTFSLDPKTALGDAPIGSYTVQWQLTGPAVSQYVASTAVNPDNQLEFNIMMNQDQPEISETMRITATITNHNGGVVVSTYDILALNETVIMTRDSNPVAMEICYQNGWTDGNANAMKKAQAEAVTSVGTAFKGVSSDFAFPEFVYFTGITSLVEGAFSGSNITEIVLPNNLINIENYCFDGCRKLKDIYVIKNINGVEMHIRELPSIREVRTGVFRNCSSLAKLTLPDSVTAIDNYAFGGTAFDRVILNSTDIQEGDLRLPIGITTIAGSAFETERWTPQTTTNRLKHLEIPRTFRITDYALIDGKNYEDFVVEDGHSSYRVDEEGVLKDVNGGTLLRYPPKKAYVETYDLPAVQRIVEYAFFAVKGIDHITSNEHATVQVILDGFCMDSDVKSVDISRLANISEIKPNSYRGCKYLENISLPNIGNIKKIGTHAFDGCSALTEITIPRGIEEIEMDASGGSYTFVGCGQLQEIVFPDTVTTMGSYTIVDCNRLKRIVFPPKFRYTFGMTRKCEYGVNVAYNCPAVSSITIPAFSIVSYDTEGEVIGSEVINDVEYLGAKWWCDFKDSAQTIPVQTRAIEGLAIINTTTAIKEILLPAEDDGQVAISVSGTLFSSNMKKIYRAPWNITTFDVPSSVTEISSRAFENSFVQNVNCGEGVEVIGSWAFRNCRNMTSFNFPTTLLSIGGEAFANGSLIEIEINARDGLTMGDQVFDMDGSLTTLRLKNVDSLPLFAFRQCYRLSTIEISTSPDKPNATILTQLNNHVMGRYPFTSCGRDAAEKKLLITLGRKSEFETEPQPGSVGTWVYMHDSSYEGCLGYTLQEAIPISGYASVTIFDDGQPFTSTVYATSSENHLIGHNGNPYSSPYDDGQYMFDLDGLYDGEVVTVYSDSGLEHEIGHFTTELWKTTYQVGEPTMSATRGAKSLVLGAGSPEDEEMAEITKAEYEELISRVDQMTKIIKKLIK